MPINLGSIKLPAEDADKPADFGETPTTSIAPPTTTTPTEATTNAQTTPTQTTETTTTATTPPTTTEGGTSNTSTTDTEVNAATQTDGTTAPDSDLSPFHKHPDWIKLQEEKKALELEMAKFKGQLEVLAKPAEAKIEPLPFASVEDMAANLIAKKKDSGWTPASAEEVAFETQKAFQQANKAFTDHDTQVKEANTKVIQAEITSTVADLGMAGAENKEKRDQLFAIAAKIDPEMKRSQKEVLQLAATLMPATVAPTTTQTTQPTVQPQAATAATNTKISKGGAGGTNTTDNKPKRTIEQFHKETLDQVMARIKRENPDFN